MSVLQPAQHFEKHRVRQGKAAVHLAPFFLSPRCIQQALNETTRRPTVAYSSLQNNDHNILLILHLFPRLALVVAWTHQTMFVVRMVF